MLVQITLTLFLCVDFSIIQLQLLVLLHLKVLRIRTVRPVHPAACAYCNICLQIGQFKHWHPAELPLSIPCWDHHPWHLPHMPLQRWLCACVVWAESGWLGVASGVAGSRGNVAGWTERGSLGEPRPGHPVMQRMQRGRGWRRWCCVSSNAFASTRTPGTRTRKKRELLQQRGSNNWTSNWCTQKSASKICTLCYSLKKISNLNKKKW